MVYVHADAVVSQNPLLLSILYIRPSKPKQHLLLCLVVPSPALECPRGLGKFGALSAPQGEKMAKTGQKAVKSSKKEKKSHGVVAVRATLDEERKTAQKMDENGSSIASIAKRLLRSRDFVRQRLLKPADSSREKHQRRWNRAILQVLNAKRKREEGTGHWVRKVSAREVLDELKIRPLPSERTVRRILTQIRAAEHEVFQKPRQERAKRPVLCDEPQELSQSDIEIWRMRVRFKL